MFYSFLQWSACGFMGGIIGSSFIEWALHRYIMHRPLWKLTYPYQRHTLTHHRIFKADYTYHLIHEKDKATIPMAWWNGPVLIALALLPFLAASALTRHWGILSGGALAISSYYGAYEYLHWCMHLPRRRNVERSGIFFRLNGHHLLHHRYMGRNFNVVFPLADLCLGTLLLRSTAHFKQAQGPSVPNVQPRLPKVALAAPKT